MFALALTLAMALQEPSPPPPPPAEAEKPAAQQAEPAPPKQVPPYSDKDAKDAVKSFVKTAKTASSMAERTKALDELGKGSHKLLVKPLADVVVGDKSLVVRKHAAQLLAMQPASEVTPVLLKLLADGGLKDKPTVQADLVRALCLTGYQKKHWAQLAGLFERNYAADCVPLHEAILDLVTQHKEQQAVELLLRNMDEPVPENVDAGENPPKEYWEARWKAWKSWRGKVKDAMFALTGQRFSSAKEAEAWLRKNGK